MLCGDQSWPREDCQITEFCLCVFFSVNVISPSPRGLYIHGTSRIVAELLSDILDVHHYRIVADRVFIPDAVVNAVGGIYLFPVRRQKLEDLELGMRQDDTLPVFDY